MIRFGTEICGSLEMSLEREWLETNRLGGYASSTLAGVNTRRYHGLLVAALAPPGRRFVLLSKLEESVEIGTRCYELSTNQYPGTIHPQGFQNLIAFRLDPFPIFTFRVGDGEIDKSVFMVRGENTTVVQYEYRGRGSASVVTKLQVRPLIAFRDYHSTTHENGSLDPRVFDQPGVASVQPYVDLPVLYFAHNAKYLISESYWYRKFQYARDWERGLNGEEDLFQPFCLEFELYDSAPATVIASLEVHSPDEAALHHRNETLRRQALPSTSSAAGLAANLAAAADQFLVSRVGGGQTVVAGYPWFIDWGRDTMISLPGVALCTGRQQEAKDILLTFARYARQGMLPNRFPDRGEEPEYNTVDAALWFFNAVNSLLVYTADYDFVRQHVYPVLADIVAWHVRGSLYGIRVDEDGLIREGESGVQLTWMDAKVGGFVVTPRMGKPVEIQALWYNALRIMEELSQKFGDKVASQAYADMAVRAQSSFNRLFWNEAAGCLYDVVNGDERDASIRPNQILAVSLPYGMLQQWKQRSVVEVVRRELLIPYGLRTLARDDPYYRGRYEGGVSERDLAYHQGTAWPWLLGQFLTAYVKVNRRSRRAREQAAKWLQPLAGHLGNAGLGQVSEIFDGDPPHTPRGCIAQAWSVGELLRACFEDVLGRRPAVNAKSLSRTAYSAAHSS